MLTLTLSRLVAFCCAVLISWNPHKNSTQQDAVVDGRLRTWRSRPKRYLTSNWCRHLANWTKLTRRLLCLPIPWIVWKHVVIQKTYFMLLQVGFLDSCAAGDNISTIILASCGLSAIAEFLVSFSFLHCKPTYPSDHVNNSNFTCFTSKN